MYVVAFIKVLHFGRTQMSQIAVPLPMYIYMGINYSGFQPQSNQHFKRCSIPTMLNHLCSYALDCWSNQHVCRLNPHFSLLKLQLFYHLWGLLPKHFPPNGNGSHAPGRRRRKSLEEQVIHLGRVPRLLKAAEPPEIWGGFTMVNHGLVMVGLWLVYGWFMP